MKNNYIAEALEALRLLESKEDQQKFVDKFGQDVFDLFNKAKQRLKNNNISTDILWHVKNTEKEDMKELLLSLYDDEKDAQKKRIIRGEHKQIRGKYKDYGIHGGFHIYEPLDYVASMDLGVNTGWCTTGRYLHAGHPEFTPSEKDAKLHFDKYTKQDIRLIYFLDPETMYGKYALAIYPSDMDKTSWHAKCGDKILKTCNFNIYNDEDRIDFQDMDNLVKLAKEAGVDADIHYELTSEDEIDQTYQSMLQAAQDAGITEGTIDYVYYGTPIPEDQRARIRTITVADDYDKQTLIPQGGRVVYIPREAFKNCVYLTDVYIPSQVRFLDKGIFSGCPGNVAIHLVPNIVDLGLKVWPNEADFYEGHIVTDYDH